MCLTWIKLLLILLLSTIVLVQSIEQYVKSIRPNEALFDERIRPFSQSGQINYYKLVSLKSNAKYEIRISYPAYYPALFRFELLSSVPHHTSTRREGARKLLNIEKTTLQTFSEMMKSSSEGEQYNSNNHLRYVQVTAERESHSFDPKIEEQDIIYNIIVEEMILFGWIPRSSLSLLCILFSILILLIIMYWYGWFEMSRIQEFLLPPSTSANSSSSSSNSGSSSSNSGSSSSNSGSSSSNSGNIHDKEQ